MARTFGGLLIYGASKIEVQSTQFPAVTSLVRNGTGDWSWNNTAGVATIPYVTHIDEIKRPYFNFPTQPGDGTVPVSNEFNELFGASAGPGNPWNGGAVPATGSQFGTANTPWGLAVINIFAIYSVTTLAPTSVTIGLNRATYVENVAFTNTAIVAPQALSTVISSAPGAPHVQAFTLPQPLVFEATDFSDLTLELSIVETATSLTRVYAIGMHVAVEYA